MADPIQLTALKELSAVTWHATPVADVLKCVNARWARAPSPPAAVGTAAPGPRPPLDPPAAPVAACARAGAPLPCCAAGARRVASGSL
jgi:hypothetical protein